jgi:hypothetical protein
MKGKVNEVKNNRNKNIRDLYRGINEFKKEYKPRINIIKDKNGNLLTDPQNVLNRWTNFFNQVLNVHGVHDVRQIDIHTAEPLVPELSLVEVEIAIGKLKSYKSPGTDQIPAELIKAGGETLNSEIHRLICSIWNKEELPQQWKESIIVPIYKKRAWMIKSRRIRRAGHAARMGEGRGVYRVLVGRPEGKRPLGRPRYRWEGNIKMDLREIGINGANWIQLAHDRVQ